MNDRVDILMVDDRQENLLALEAILEPLGEGLVRANSGDEALRCVLTRDFACILLDVQMPGLSGFDTARLIKARERSRHIPIIFLTAISKEQEYVFEGYSVGAVDYMSKPFQPDILRSKVAVFVELYRRQRQVRQQEELLREHERRSLELRHRAEMLESEARFGEIVNSALDAIVSFDESRRITLFNGAAAALFGLPVERAIGQDIGALFPERFRDEYLGRICAEAGSRRVAGGAADAAPEVESFVGLRAGAIEFPIEASVSCFELPAGHLYTIIARDVSERRRAEESLRAQALSLAASAAKLRTLNDELNARQRDLERAMTARSRFYASMSHELRTPINAILGYNTLLLENIYGALNDKQADGLRRTQRAAKHLLELVNDVLDLSKIEAGKLELKLQPVAFPVLIEDLFVTVRPMAEERGSTLSLEHGGDTVNVTTDPRRVRQILLNLLSNAIKFGRGNPIHVISTVRDDGGVTVDVTDRGVGIPPEDLPRVFDEFVQLARTPEHEGTGLGLPISRRLALLLQGELSAESVVGQGSTFRLVLPAQLDPGTAAREQAVALAASDAERPLPRAIGDRGAAERPADHAGDGTDDRAERKLPERPSLAGPRQ
ncbi:MAG TPA: ATP-binding protein [Gemmatimonadaceae bacterium]|nr:ATP-binding protein [Gemmatimonadaceae bacterium]